MLMESTDKSCDGRKWWHYSAFVREINFKVHHMDSALYLAADSMFGLAILYMIIYFDVFGQFSPFLYYSIEKLNLLIDWLTQYPAGLKLNDQLNEPLSSFFKYHIELWQKNINLLNGIAEPLKNWTRQLLFLLAFTGASVMLATFSDFIRVATLHMYCFHLYTLRLTSVFWRGIQALAKAFRGKKWNPLRRRVDSVRLDPRQLFMATLLFIVLLFLLPTILVYFVVFSCLYKPYGLIQLWYAIDIVLNAMTFTAGKIRYLADEDAVPGGSVENVLANAKLPDLDQKTA